MENELILKKSWSKRNWNWFLPVTLLLLFAIGLFFSLLMDTNISDLAKGYSDNSLLKKAFEKAKTNQRVLEVLGNLEPIDKLAILEGSIKYSNKNNSVALTIRIKGSKEKGKMDITADKNGTHWKYNKINIRIKATNEEIKILEFP